MCQTRGGPRVHVLCAHHLHDVPVGHAVLPGVRARGRLAPGVTTVICRSEEGVWGHWAQVLGTEALGTVVLGTGVLDKVLSTGVLGKVLVTGALDKVLSTGVLGTGYKGTGYRGTE